jgi:hypothetical protein
LKNRLKPSRAYIPLKLVREVPTNGIQVNSATITPTKLKAAMANFCWRRKSKSRISVALAQINRMSSGRYDRRSGISADDTA